MLGNADITRINDTDVFFNGYVDYNKIKNVLDYGGADGQFISSKFKTDRKYVYDPSNIDLLAGIKRITDNDLYMGFDFIQCNNIFEQVSDIYNTMKNVLKFSHDRTQFYFEVPYDTPLNSIKVQMGMKYPQLYKIFCDICGIDTNHFIMHEHINHFSVKSLSKFLELQCLYIDKIDVGIITYHGRTIRCLAKY